MKHAFLLPAAIVWLSVQLVMPTLLLLARRAISQRSPSPFFATSCRCLLTSTLACWILLAGVDLLLGLPSLYTHLLYSD